MTHACQQPVAPFQDSQIKWASCQAITIKAFRQIVCLLGTPSLGLVMLLAAPTSAVAAEPASFPWGCENCGPPMPPSRAPYQTLPKANTAAARPIDQLPAKVPYAYGWFGSNPSPQWSRQFGSSRAFTQWTRK